MEKKYYNNELHTEADAYFNIGLSWSHKDNPDRSLLIVQLISEETGLCVAFAEYTDGRLDREGKCPNHPCGIHYGEFFQDANCFNQTGKL